MIEHLIKYPNILREIEKLTADLEIVTKAKLNADGCLKTSIMSDPIQPGVINDPTYRHTENLFAHFEEICLELELMAENTKVKIKNLLWAKEKIDKMLKKIDKMGLANEKRFIEMKYFQQLPTRKLTEAFDCNRKTIWRLEMRVKSIVKELL